MASFSILVNSAPLDSQGSYSAYQFAQALLNKNHKLNGVFFYQQAAMNANAFNQSFSDEINLYASWCELAVTHKIALQVCITAANRRGAITQQDAADIDTEYFNISAPFEAVGLGELMQLMQDSDKLVQF